MRESKSFSFRYCKRDFLIERKVSLCCARQGLLTRLRSLCLFFSLIWSNYSARHSSDSPLAKYLQNDTKGKTDELTSESAIQILISRSDRSHLRRDKPSRLHGQRRKTVRFSRRPVRSPFSCIILPKSVAKDYLKQTTEIVQWLKQHPNLSE